MIDPTSLLWTFWLFDLWLVTLTVTILLVASFIIFASACLHEVKKSLRKLKD